MFSMRFRFGQSKVNPFSAVAPSKPLNRFNGTLFRTYQTSPFCYIFLTNHMSTVEDTFDKHWLKFQALKIPREEHLRIAKLLVDHNVEENVLCANSLRVTLKNIFALPDPKQVEQKRQRLEELKAEHKAANEELQAAQVACSPHLEKEIYSRCQEALYQAQVVENTLLMRIHQVKLELDKPTLKAVNLQLKLKQLETELDMAAKVTQRAQKEFDQPIESPDYQAENQRVYNAEVKINKILAEISQLSLELNDPSVITRHNYDVRFGSESQKRIAVSHLDHNGEVQEYSGDNSYEHYLKHMQKLKEELNIDAILDSKQASTLKLK